MPVMSTDDVVEGLNPNLTETQQMIRFLRRNGVKVFKNQEFFVSFDDIEEISKPEKGGFSGLDVPDYVRQIFDKQYPPLNEDDA